MNNFRKFKKIAIRYPPFVQPALGLSTFCQLYTTLKLPGGGISYVSIFSCYHFVTRLMTATDLLQVVPTRLVQAVRVTSCYELVVINLLRADDIRLVGKTCCESVGLNLVTR